MMFSVPWYFYVFIGVFIGLLLGNAKFRRECDAILARMLGSKKGKKKNGASTRDNAIGGENGDKQCVICNRQGLMAIIFDNGRWLCRQCLVEIEGSQVNRTTRRSGTHVREIFFDDN